MNIEQNIFQFLQNTPTKSASADEMAAAFNLTGDDIIKLFTVLDEKTRSGAILQDEDGLYFLPQKGGFVIGTLNVNSKGYGFVIPLEQEERDKGDIFIPAENFSDALNGDKVACKVTMSGGNRLREGYVEKIIEHKNEKIVGTFKKEKGFGLVEPDDTKLPSAIFIHKRSFNNAKDNDKVVCKVTKWPRGKHRLEAIIEKVLGREDDPGVDMLSVLHQYGLPEDFNAKVKNAARKVPLQIDEVEYKKRQKDDRRHLPIVTIDGEDAKDLDDGVYATTLPNGNFQLGVFIADVSYYVRENSVLDLEARKRGTSVYLADRVLPMLPQRLSNGICSLNAGEDRLSMAIEMEIDTNGSVLNYHIFQTIIKVHRRLSYTIVNKILIDNDEKTCQEYSDVVPMLKLLAKLRQALKNRRNKRGAIDFNLPELKVKLDEKGHPIEIIKRCGSLGESIIEECMLVANETVAEHMFKKKLPFIYRIHEQPDGEKITALNDFLASFNLHINKEADGTVKPKAIQAVIEKIQGTPLEKVILPLALRSMRQARYCETDLGHFGLAASYYTHFTSPIRRYPDLIVHRLLHETLRTGRISENRTETLNHLLPQIALDSSVSERTAINAERDSIDIKKIEYMSAFVGEKFHGIISSVTSFGLFIELDNGVEGLLHVSSLTDDYYEFVQEQYAMIGAASGRRYRIGDEIEVILARADVKERLIDFVLADKGGENLFKKMKKESAKKTPPAKAKHKAAHGKKKKNKNHPPETKRRKKRHAGKKKRSMKNGKQKQRH